MSVHPDPVLQLILAEHPEGERVAIERLYYAMGMRHVLSPVERAQRFDEILRARKTAHGVATEQWIDRRRAETDQQQKRDDITLLILG